jgi:hypothetical protein
MRNIVNIALSIVLVAVFYGLVLIILDQIARKFSSSSYVGDVAEKALLWLGHFGFGFIIYPVLVAVVFIWLRKRDG